jgi:hypothetical protein
MPAEQPAFNDDALLDQLLRHIDNRHRFPAGSEGERLRRDLWHRLKETRKSIYFTVIRELNLSVDDPAGDKIMNAIWSAIEPAEIDACVAILALEEIQRLSPMSVLKAPGIAKWTNNHRAWPLGYDLSLAKR